MLYTVRGCLFTSCLIVFPVGGLVVARSVKFLGKLEATLSDQETREGWWEELRDEIKQHAKVLCCSHIIGYQETSTVYGDVCVLSALGTAAVVENLGHPLATATCSTVTDTSSPDQATRFLDINDMSGGGYGHNNATVANSGGSGKGIRSRFSSEFTGPSHSHSAASAAAGSPILTNNDGNSDQEEENVSIGIEGEDETSSTVEAMKCILKSVRRKPKSCAFAHVPYNHNTAPFAFMRLVPCMSCRRKWVPETILATVEPPQNASFRGKGQLLEARVCRARVCPELYTVLC